jgi:hypothetical protein
MMNLHLAEIAAEMAPGKHAVLLVHAVWADIQYDGAKPLWRPSRTRPRATRP